jgi:hypothetical protein
VFSGNTSPALQKRSYAVTTFIKRTIGMDSQLVRYYREGYDKECRGSGARGRSF